MFLHAPAVICVHLCVLRTSDYFFTRYLFVYVTLSARKMVFGAVAKSAGISQAACVKILAHRALEGLDREVGI